MTFFAALRGPSWTKVLPLTFFAALRGPSRIEVLTLTFFVVFRGPSWKKVLPMTFFAPLRGQKGILSRSTPNERPPLKTKNYPHKPPFHRFDKHANL